MTIRIILCTTVLALVGIGLFGRSLQAADDGVAHVRFQQPAAAGNGHASSNQYYMLYGSQARKRVNPTYWTWMPKPFHGCCDYCGSTNCSGHNGVWTAPAVRWLLDPDYYAVAPDYGWSPPSKRPIVRNNVTYQKRRPDTWYGERTSGKPIRAKRYPIIAQPTDTSQMGYYYQHVPTWQPRNILPQPPHPRHWHVRDCIPGSDGSYTKWVKLQDVYVPLDQIPNAQQQQITPQPIPEPVPIEAAPVPNVRPEALNEPITGSGVRRAGY